MRNGWVEQSRGAVAGAQAVGVKFRRRMGRSLVTHYEKFMQVPLIFRLLFTYAYTIIYAMQNKNSKKARSRAEILAEIAALPPSIQGTISSYRCPRKNGPPAVYHNFQYTLKGKNHSMTIPVGMVDDFKAAVASGKKLKDLVLELSATDAKALAEQASALKKNSHTSS